MNMKNVFQKEITMDIKKHVAGPAEGPPPQILRLMYLAQLIRLR